MKLTVLGGAGAWPSAAQPCSGYLLEYQGHTLLLDPGYGSFAALQRYLAAGELGAVAVTHGHPDHCADLNPLLRARALEGEPPLPVYAPRGALDRVLALDQVAAVRSAGLVHELRAREPVRIGTFEVLPVPLPHHVVNLGLRVTGGDRLAYTGDTGPSAAVTELAADADVLLAEATYPETVPEEDAAFLSSARQAGEYARDARVGELLLTHLWPGTDPARAIAAARPAFPGPIRVAEPGLEWPSRPR
ncbi:MBL fold metallo-hydrolase [Sciscionella sediminilitoris]|uniref:MBL fold metallo-hydrolase n=1 Tax=Sciscionella sediminilitoris TaxID=1445613 RepID=UPI0004DF260C|nr:MBL fold metallo-hydrolase [Sciscionella sp. SE31]